MKLEIPGQLRGRDAGKVMPVAVRLRRELEPSFAALGEDKLKLISPILRIGGERGTFGADGIENIKIRDKEAECDVVIEGRNWNEMSEDQIHTMLRPRVFEALSTLISEAGYGAVPEFLSSEINLTEQAHGEQRPTRPESKDEP
jgi:hypothetical protein